MVDCPGCGAYLHYDIESKKLLCDYCGQSFSVSEAEDYRRAKEVTETEEPSNEMAVYEFSCPQCGGHIYGERQDLTGFCSYCGTPVELAGRLTQLEKPKYIIPFTKTKEDCKKAFVNFTKKAVFTPSGYRDETHVDSFRGIYMPYHVFDVTEKGKFTVTMRGLRYRVFNYIHTKMYKVNGKMKAEYVGFEHDASRAFDDDISESLSPYVSSERLPFNEGYVSGFYADGSDVGSVAFSEDAKEVVAGETKRQILDAAVKEKRGLRDAHRAIKGVNRDVKAEKALYPVWFMSYRNGDRVAYAAVNGQTGKIMADLPIDFRKFLIAAAIATIPLFFLLNGFFTVRPRTMAGLFAAVLAACCIGYHNNLRKIMDHDGMNFSDERRKLKEGLKSGNVNAGGKSGKAGGVNTVRSSSANVSAQRARKKDDPSGTVFKVIGIAVLFLFLFVCLNGSVDASGKPSLSFAVLVGGVSALLVVIMTLRAGTLCRIFKRYSYRISGFTACVLSAVISVISAFMLFLNPVQDIWYYGSCIL
ncbi:MAG: hypothetical protein HUJ73_04290, partial [Eubacterium sp.]|nr:hypothetical protein [Eubacterium sp.]